MWGKITVHSFVTNMYFKKGIIWLKEKKTKLKHALKLATGMQLDSLVDHTFPSSILVGTAGVKMARA